MGNGRHTGGTTRVARALAQPATLKATSRITVRIPNAATKNKGREAYRVWRTDEVPYYWLGWNLPTRRTCAGSTNNTGSRKTCAESLTGRCSGNPGIGRNDYHDERLTDETLVWPGWEAACRKAGCFIPGSLDCAMKRRGDCSGCHITRKAACLCGMRGGYVVGPDGRPILPGSAVPTEIFKLWGMAPPPDPKPTPKPGLSHASRIFI